MKAIIAYVNKLVDHFETRCPFELCSELNITLMNSDLPRPIKGFFVNILDRPFIYLNSALPDEEKRVILAHEIGHAILHSTQNSLYLRSATYLVVSRYELQADMFAAQLLLEDHLFDEVRSGFDTLEKISSYTAVPLSYVQLKWDSLCEDALF